MNPYFQAPSSASASLVHTSVPPEEEVQSLNDVTHHGHQTSSLSSLGQESAAPRFSNRMNELLNPTDYDFNQPRGEQGVHDGDLGLGLNSKPTSLSSDPFGLARSAQPHQQTCQPTPSLLPRPPSHISLPSSIWNSVNGQRFLGNAGASLSFSTSSNAGSTTHSARWSSVQADHVEGQPRDVVPPVANSSFVHFGQEPCDRSATPSETQPTIQCSEDLSCPDGTCKRPGLQFSSFGNLVRHYSEIHKNKKLSEEDAQGLVERRPPMAQCEYCGQLITPDVPGEQAKGKRHRCQRDPRRVARRTKRHKCERDQTPRATLKPL